jgi:hypothetical protein
MSPPISWLLAVIGSTIRPAAKARTADLAGAQMHPHLDELGAKGELDTVLELGAAGEDGVALVELLHSLGRHPMRGVFGVGLDRTV